MVLFFRSVTALFIFFALLQNGFAAGSDSGKDNPPRILFSPADECGNYILRSIEGAKESIELAIYHITSRPLAKALIAAAKRGLSVRVYVDGENADERYSKVSYMKRHGLKIKAESGEGLMHNKFCIIDNAKVITGSYNWTTSADLRNDENIVIIDSLPAVRLYRVQFEKYWLGTYEDEAFYSDKKRLKKH